MVFMQLIDILTALVVDGWGFVNPCAAQGRGAALGAGL